MRDIIICCTYNSTSSINRANLRRVTLYFRIPNIVEIYVSHMKSMFWCCCIYMNAIMCYLFIVHKWNNMYVPSNWAPPVLIKVRRNKTVPNNIMTFLLLICLSLLTVFQLLLSEQTNTGEIKNRYSNYYHELNMYILV